MDQRTVEFLIHQPKSNQLVEIQNNTSNNVSTTITRDFEPNQMKVGLLVNGVTAESYFKRRINEKTHQNVNDNSAFSTRK